MTLDGQFATTPRPSGPRVSWPVRLGVGAVLVAVLAGVVAVALLALWFALVLIPVALVAGLVGWGALRFQLWRARRARAGGGPLRP